MLWPGQEALTSLHGLLTLAIDYMEVPITKVLGCGQTVQKAHMSAVGEWAWLSQRASPLGTVGHRALSE